MEAQGYLYATDSIHNDYENRWTCVFYYELLKRPGWCNRYVESVKYVGDCKYQHKVSLDVSHNELYKHFEDSYVSPKRVILLDDDFCSPEDNDDLSIINILPVCNLLKSQIYIDISAVDSYSNPLQVITRYEGYALARQILCGCLYKYYEKHNEFDMLPPITQASILNQFYENTGLYEDTEQSNGLYPHVNPCLPSKRMMIHLDKYIETDYPFGNMNQLINAINLEYTETGIPDRLGNTTILSDTEQAAWSWMIQIFEFKSLLFFLHRYRLYWLRIDDLSSSTSNCVVKFQYTEVENLFDIDTEGYTPGCIREALKCLQKTDTTNLFVTGTEDRTPTIIQRVHDYLQSKNFYTTKTYQTSLRIAISCFIGAAYGSILGRAYSFSIGVLLSALIATLFYSTLSRDFIYGISTYFGKIISNRLVVGVSETEHYTFYAPDGIIFSPLNCLDIRRTLTQQRGVSSLYLSNLLAYVLLNTYASQYMLDNLISFEQYQQVIDTLDLQKVRILEKTREHSDNRSADIQIALAPASISFRSSQPWNNHDPWDYSSSTPENKGGHRYRRFAYVEREKTRYIYQAKARPKTGLRSIVYLLTPLVTLGVFFVLNNLTMNTAVVSYMLDKAIVRYLTLVIQLRLLNDIPLVHIAPSVLNETYIHSFSEFDIFLQIVLSLIPLTGTFLVQNEDEPFVKRKFVLLPRACWIFSIVIAVIGSVIYLVKPLHTSLWPAYCSISYAILAILSILTFIWFMYHKWCDRWTLSNTALEVFTANVEVIKE
jgi:hypothetical protein